MVPNSVQLSDRSCSLVATFKLPERLELRVELPRNPLGKILKRELRDELRT